MVKRSRHPRHWTCPHPRCPKGVTVYSELPEAPVHQCHPRGDKIYGLVLERQEPPEGGSV